MKDHREEFQEMIRDMDNEELFQQLVDAEKTLEDVVEMDHKMSDGNLEPLIRKSYQYMFDLIGAEIDCRDDWPYNHPEDDEMPF